jgi:hypothetical protein
MAGFLRMTCRLGFCRIYAFNEHNQNAFCLAAKTEWFTCLFCFKAKMQISDAERKRPKQNKVRTKQKQRETKQKIAEQNKNKNELK